MTKQKIKEEEKLRKKERIHSEKNRKSNGKRNQLKMKGRTVLQDDGDRASQTALHETAMIVMLFKGK